MGVGLAYNEKTAVLIAPVFAGYVPVPPTFPPTPHPSDESPSMGGWQHHLILRNLSRVNHSRCKECIIFDKVCI